MSCTWREVADSVANVFDELAEDELAAAYAAVGDAGIEAARLHAAARLVAGPADGLGEPGSLVALMMARDRSDARWERLEPFELRWSLLVLRLLDSVVKDPWVAVADARRRGATWAAIAKALGVTPPSAHSRFRRLESAADKDKTPK